MKFLLIYGHPNPQSFNHAILETLSKRLKHHGQDVRIRDLYGLGFDPVLKLDEMKASEKGTVAPDVKSEQAHISWSEMLVFISPIWWGGFTSIMRGYLDRVFSPGFAYEEGSQGIQPLLCGKKVFTINTLAAPQKVYEQAGLFQCMNKIFDEIICPFCGLHVAGHHYCSFVDACSHQERVSMLAGIEALADRLAQH